MRSGRAPRVAAVLGLILLGSSGACRPVPAKALRAAAERGHSWIAGADMAADLWTRGIVPSALARVALDDARRGLETERARLGKKADVMRDARVEEAVRALDAASIAASRLRGALTRDRAEVEAARADLRAADARLQAAAAP